MPDTIYRFSKLKEKIPKLIIMTDEFTNLQNFLPDALIKKGCCHLLATSVEISPAS